jgi:hypothetical protein
VKVVGGSSMVLTLSDNSSVTYSSDGGQLRRAAGGGFNVLARNIAGVNFSVSGRLITMDISSAPPGRDSVSQNGVYRVLMRPAELIP